jgi:hypothetical protein
VIESKDKTFTVACDRCRTMATLSATTFDASVAELAARGWLECARRGQGRDRWHWWCPSCNPSNKTKSLGRST